MKQWFCGVCIWYAVNFQHKEQLVSASRVEVWSISPRSGCNRYALSRSRPLSSGSFTHCLTAAIPDFPESPKRQVPGLTKRCTPFGHEELYTLYVLLISCTTGLYHSEEIFPSSFSRGPWPELLTPQKSCGPCPFWTGTRVKQSSAKKTTDSLWLAFALLLLQKYNQRR